MDTSNGIVYTTKEWAYICAHCMWQEPDLTRFVATCIGESQLHSNAYRPASQNPGIPATVPKNRAGHDWSIAMLSDYFFPVDDPFRRLDPITACRDALDIYRKHGLQPWGWGTKRNDANMGVDALRAEIGTEPYAIMNSPYGRMKAAGINTWDMPVPPAGLYVSPLPDAPLVVGKGNFPPDPIGIRNNQLQRVALSMNRWSGTLDYFYGSRLTDFVKSVQVDLWRAGLWAGLLDGKAYSTALRAVWDGILMTEAAFARGTLTGG